MPDESVSPTGPDLFTWAHWGCGAFVGLLALVLVISFFYGIMRAFWPTSTVRGTAGPVAEIRLNSHRAAYQLMLESEGGEQLTLRLRNNGRIHRYLANQPAGQLVSVRHAQGEIWELAPLAPAGPALREFPPAWPALLLLLTGGGIFLYFLAGPWLATLPLSRFRSLVRPDGHHEPER
jgi:hypothetical protein